jgi:hypothetical protein
MTQQTLYPVANSVGPQQVRETDSAYIIEDVPIVTNMELAGGYVPEQSIRNTAEAWDGATVTLNHPRDDRGRPVAANRQPGTHLGETENARYDGSHVRGDIRLSKERLRAQGNEAEQIKDALRNGDPIDVSSQYAAESLPPGEYDGEHRSNVERITRPDSVAILPQKNGVCSIESGCGINPQLAANADVSVPMTANKYDDKDTDMDAAAEADFEPGDLVRWSTSDSPGTGRVADVVTEPGATVSAEGADVTREATAEEPAYKLDNYVGPEAGFDEGVVVKSASELIGEWDDAPEEAMSANMAVPGDYRFDNPGEAVEKAQAMGFDGAGDEVIHTHEADGETIFMPAPDHETLVERLREMGELDGDMSENALASAFNTLRAAIMGADDGTAPEAPAVATATATATETANATSEGVDGDGGDAVDREALIEDITTHSALTRNALDARCNDGLAAIHDDVMAAVNTSANGEASSDETQTPDSDMTDDPIELDDLSDDAQDALVDEAVERIEANREDEQKADLVGEIIANSADYDSDDRETLLEAPIEVLRGLKPSGTAAAVPGAGATANARPDTGGDRADEYPDGTIGGDL